IQYRVPEYGWTTQKVFQLLNFIVNGDNSSFIFIQIFQHVIIDLPGLAFFTTYISYQTRGLETEGLRSGFYTINGVIYAIQVKHVLSKYQEMCALISLSSIFYLHMNFQTYGKATSFEKSDIKQLLL
ncbi:hypothetical protein ABZP36_035617, partial [Zizania latifolia]